MLFVVMFSVGDICCSELYKVILLHNKLITKHIDNASNVHSPLSYGFSMHFINKLNMGAIGRQARQNPKQKESSVMETCRSSNC